MALIDKNTVRHLSRLARIACSEEEQENLLKDLKRILEYIAQLDEVDTSSLEPCQQVIPGMQAPLRSDEIGNCLPREEFLANTQHTGGMVRVPPVIKSS